MNEPTNFLTSPLKNCALALLAAAAMSGASLAQFNKPPETGRVVEPRTRLESDDTVSAAAFSPDGKTVVTSNGRALKFWDAATGRLKKTADFHAVNCPDCHRRRITFIAFSPDGKRIATGSEDMTAKLWDAETGAVLATLEGMDTVNSLAFSPDGKTLATATSSKGDGELRIWDVTGAAPKLLGTLGVPKSGTLVSVAYSPDGKTLATADYGHPWVRLWDAATGNPKKTIELPEMDASGQYEALHRIAFSPGGQTVATGGNRAGRLVDVSTGKVVATLPHEDVVRAVAFSRDGKLVATASGDKTAKIWDAATGKLIATLAGHMNMLHVVAFSPDGRTVVTGAESLALLWDVP